MYQVAVSHRNAFEKKGIEMKRNIFPKIIILLVIILFSGTLCSAAESKDMPGTKLQQERMMAINAIQNLMGKYVLYHFANMYDDPRYADLFAKDPDTKVQTSKGIWVGEKAGERILKYYLIMTGGNGFAGQMHYHPVNTPIIEVAGDGKTAKGVWLSDGIEVSPKDGVGTGMWLTVKYAVDFKKMPEGWKIWHLRTNGVFLVQVGSDSVGMSMPPGGSGGGGPAPKREEPEIDEGLKPDLTYKGQPIYDATTVQVLDPLPPEPYETWDESMSYLPNK